MGYTLSTEALQEQFGEIRLEINTQDGNFRTSCIRKVSDNKILAYSTVEFHSEGVEKFDTISHQKIMSGEPLGKVIRASGVPHERAESIFDIAQINFGLRCVFNTKQEIASHRKINYTIESTPYITIHEFYNPEYISIPGGSIVTADPLPINKKDWCVVSELRDGYEDEYLALAHGFLKKPMHIGIEDQSQFIETTRETLNLLMKDTNTELPVLANSTGFIGYAAINIHPALHINGFECMVRELYVKEDEQHKHRGTLIMQYVERIAVRHTCKRISLATKWDDDKQRGFYESIGFSRRCDFVVKKL